MVWICAILNLLDDPLRVWLHERALRHAHRHHLLVGGRVATDTVIGETARLLVMLFLEMVAATALMLGVCLEQWMRYHHHVPCRRGRFPVVFDGGADDFPLRCLLQIWIVDRVVVSLEMLGLVEAVLLVALLVHLFQLGAPLTSGLLDRDRTHRAISIMA